MISEDVVITSSSSNGFLAAAGMDCIFFLAAAEMLKLGPGTAADFVLDLKKEDPGFGTGAVVTPDTRGNGKALPVTIGGNVLCLASKDELGECLECLMVSTNDSIAAGLGCKKVSIGAALSEAKASNLVPSCKRRRPSETFPNEIND